MEEAIHLGDQIAVMDAGQLRAIRRRPAEILASPADALRRDTGRHRPTGRSGCCRSRPSASAVEPGTAEGEPIPVERQPARRAAPNCCGRARPALPVIDADGRADRPGHRRRTGRAARRGPRMKPALPSCCGCWRWRCCVAFLLSPQTFAPLLQAADPEQRAGDLHPEQPADADAGASAHRVARDPRPRHRGRWRSRSSSPGRSAPNSCRCRAAS